jgi:hypothetical protein
MEACVGAHHLSRKLASLGHDARLMPAKYVRPYSKGPASFTNIVQLMRVSYKLPKPETPRFTTLDVLDQMPRYPRLHNLKHLPTTWLGPSHHMPSAHALVAIEQFLRQSIAYNTDIRPKDKLMPRVR